MPRYYFDLQDGQFIPDTDGTELDGIDAAREEAATSLADFAKDVLSESDAREVVVHVREEGGPVLFTAKLIYEMTDANE